jgi:stress-induced morphogen
MNIQEKIEKNLRFIFGDGVKIYIENTSHKHASHAGLQGLKTANSHFEIEITVPPELKFSTLERHKQANLAVKDAYEKGVHSISFKFKNG